MESDAPTWAAFWEGFELFRDPILCAAIAGIVLGFLGVYIVLRRMVFVSAAVTQSAGLGVALTFYLQIHLGRHLDPILGAAGASLLASLLFVLDPRRNAEMIHGKAGPISTPDSRLAAYVIPTDEELRIARDTVRVLLEDRPRRQPTAGRATDARR